MLQAATHVTGIHPNNIEEEMRVYPNPTAGLLEIEWNWQVKKVFLYDLMGRKMLTTDQNGIDIQDLGSGIYILSIDFQNHKRRIIEVVKN